MKNLLQPNNELRALLLDKENIPVLEFLLEREAEALTKLQRLRAENRLDFGEEVKKEDFETLFHDVKGRVDDFLGFNDIEMPSLCYDSIPKSDKRLSLLSSLLGAVFLAHGFLEKSYVSLSLSITFFGVGAVSNLISRISPNAYCPSDKLIRLEKKEKASLVRITVHEYTHHIQNMKMDEKQFGKYKIFREGHADGVARHISKLYAESEGNIMFGFGSTDWAVFHLKNSYNWTCKRLGIKKSDSLLKITGNNPVVKPSKYDVGNTLFYIKEPVFGSQIYKEILG